MWCWAYEGAGAQIEAAKTMSAEEQDNMQNAQCADIRAAYDAAMPQEWKDAGEWKEYFTEHGCPEEPDAPPVRIMVRVPNDVKDGEKLATIFGICGGGMIGGGVPEMILGYTSGLVLATGIKTVIVALQYRLAPAHPYPASLNDCHTAYMWMAEHAEELHIDLDKVMMWGNSSGGHLALGLGFRLQKYDFYGNMPRGIMAIMPVLDDTPLTESGKYSFIGESGTPEGWDGSMTIDSAKMWLGDLYGDPYLTPEAIPGRATVENFKAGYPPVWFPCNAEFDPGRDTMYKLASLMHQAGVFCDVHVWGGCSHMTAAGQGYHITDRIAAVEAGAFRDAVTYDFRRKWIVEE